MADATSDIFANASEHVETGIKGDSPLTAPVTEPAPSPDAPTPPDPEQIKNAHRLLAQIPKDLDADKLTALAQELAKDIRDQGVILSDYNLTTAHLDYLKAHNEFFKHTLAAAIQEWRSVKSTQERVKLHAAAILEDSLLHIGHRMQRPGENLTGVVEAGKLLAKVAGLDLPDKAAQAPGQRFNIQINIGAGQSISHSSPPRAQTIDSGAAREPTPRAITISADGER